MATSQHTQARKNLTKDEFHLFSRSFPGEVSKLSSRRLAQAIAKAERILRKYRAARGKVTDDRASILDFRLKSLSEARERFSKKLEGIESPKSGSTKKTKKSLTAQRKMRVDLKGNPRDEFSYSEKNKIYAKKSLEPRQKASPARAMSKRIAGYMKARTRKGQVAQDRITSAKEE